MMNEKLEFTPKEAKRFYEIMMNAKNEAFALRKENDELKSKLTAAQDELEELRKLADRQYLGRDMIEKNLKYKLTVAQAEIERLKSLLKLVMVQITPEMLLEIYDLIVLIRNFKSSITPIEGKEKPNE